MSESGSENLPKQLEGLFTGLFDTRTLKPRDQDRLRDLYGGFPRGWAWEADSEGILLWVSPEVGHLMGFSPEELIGRSILAFANSPSSAEDLQIALSTKRSIRNLYIEGISREGNTLTLLINGLARSVGSPPALRYRGVAQVLGVTEKLVESVEGPRSQTARTGPVQLGPAIGYSIDEGQIHPAPPVRDSEIPKQPVFSNSLLQVPIANAAGDPIGVLEFERGADNPHWVQEDIDLVAQVSRQLAVALQDVRSNQLTQQALQEVQEADLLKSQFLANMTHELRTPLNSIIGFSRVILKGIDGPITETQKHDLNSIYKAGQHLLGLINNILDFSKIDSGRMELTISEVDLSEIIREAIATASGLVKDKPVELVTKIDDNLPVLYADPVRTRQILLNLVSNSAKFTELGEIGITARLSRRGSRQEVLVSVYDTGSGIASEDQRKLFEPFSQLDSSISGQTGGTGLGLSISRHLVELQGGRIWVESTPGKGSTFFFTIPLPGEGDMEEIALESQSVLAFSFDQEKLNRLGNILSEKGIRFQSISDKENVIGNVLEFEPSAILVDPAMSEGAGWNLIATLKHNEGTGSFPVNTFSLSKDLEKGFDLGVGDFIAKPVRVSDLQAAYRFLRPGDRKELDTLIIDNVDEDLHAIRLQFESLFPGSVRTATSGFEGLIAARQQVPDLIVLSLFMAKADGFRMMEALRVDARTRNVPIILLIPGELNDTHLRQLRLWTNHNYNKANLSIDAYADRLMERLQGGIES